MKSRFLAFALLPLLLLGGCTVQSVSQKSEAVVQALLNVAKAEEPNLPPADGTILTQWVNLGNTLLTSTETCTAGAGTSKSKALACFNIFAAGLLSNQELTQLRIMSPASQAKAQLWVTAIVVGVNVAVQSFSSTPVPTPTVAANVTVTPQQLAELRAEIGQ